MRRVLIGFTALMGFATANAATYQIDPTHTYPNFTIDHLGYSMTYGRFGATSGTIDLDLAKKTGAVNIVIDAASIDTGFKKRDDHLRSPDFFNVNEFPQITYKSTSVKFTSDSTAKVDGQLTIMGVTKPVSLDVTRIKCAVHPMNKKDVCGFDAKTAIKRSDFGVKYALPAVGDEVQIMIQAEGVKQ
ncbi:MAG: YceI family protein [Gammaproteobacteria bacterium]|nr:YceI family protein [Gammaproteobacteria bacterium]